MQPKKIEPKFLIAAETKLLHLALSIKSQAKPPVYPGAKPGLCWCGKHFLRSTEFTFKLRRAQRRSGRFWWSFYTKQQPTIQRADTVLVLRNLEPVWGKKSKMCLNQSNQIWTLDTRNHSIAPGIDPLSMAPGSFHDARTWVIHFAAPTPHVVQANSLDGYASKPKFSVGYWCCQNCLSKLTWTSVK